VYVEAAKEGGFVASEVRFQPILTMVLSDLQHLLAVEWLLARD
jgi:hypothetical protein